MNKVILIGNLTKDVEMRQTSGGKNVATCSLATNKKYKDQAGQMQQVVQFHNLVIWGAPADTFAKYLRKGSKVGIIGELNTRDYTGKDGVKRYQTDVVVSDFEFLTPQNNDQGVQPEYAGNYSQPQQNADEEISIENIPF